MYSIESFSSREEKIFFLKEVIVKLNISESEKEIYLLCLEILDETAFNTFFLRIFSQIQEGDVKIQSIEPFTSTLI